MKRVIRSITAAIVAISALLGGGFAEARNTVVAEIRVDDSFRDWGIRWGNEGASGRYVARIKITEIDGMIALCGVGHLTRISLAKANRAGLRAKFLTYEGQEILRDLTFFNRVNSEAALETAMAHCALTRLRAQDVQGGRFSIDSNQSSFTGG